MRLLLVRHGESLANRQRLVTGDAVVELTEHGCAQMQHAGAMLQKIGFVAKHHFTSHYRRAQQSAQLLLPGVDFQVDSRLGETDAGNVANLPQDQFLAQWPDFYTDHRNAYPDGESHADLNARVMAWLDQTRNQCEGTVLVVAHAGPIVCLLQHALGIPMERFPALLPRNGSISVIDYAGASATGELLAFSFMPEAASAALFMREGA